MFAAPDPPLHSELEPQHPTLSRHQRRRRMMATVVEADGMDSDDPIAPAKLEEIDKDTKDGKESGDPVYKITPAEPVANSQDEHQTYIQAR